MQEGLKSNREGNEMQKQCVSKLQTPLCWRWVTMSVPVGGEHDAKLLWPGLIAWEDRADANTVRQIGMARFGVTGRERRSAGAYAGTAACGFRDRPGAFLQRFKPHPGHGGGRTEVLA